MAEKIPAAIEDVKAFRKQHGNTKIGEITVDMVSLKLDIFQVISNFELVIYYILINYMKRHARISSLHFHQAGSFV